MALKYKQKTVALSLRCVKEPFSALLGSHMVTWCGFNVGADLIRLISWKTELPKVRRSGVGKVLKEQRWDGGGEREAQVFPSGGSFCPPGTFFPITEAELHPHHHRAGPVWQPQALWVSPLTTRPDSGCLVLGTHICSWGLGIRSKSGGWRGRLKNVETQNQPRLFSLNF